MHRKPTGYTHVACSCSDGDLRVTVSPYLILQSIWSIQNRAVRTVQQQVLEIVLKNCL